MNTSHPDASACLLIDGNLVGAISEERLGKRIKHTNSFPIESIKYLMKTNGVRLKDINYIATGSNPTSNIFRKISLTLKNFNQSKYLISNFIKKNKDNLNLLHHRLGVSDTESKFKIHKVEHHLSHICSSYYCSDFDGMSAGMSFDGSGDNVSLMMAKCEGNEIKILDRIYFPNSLGHFYTSLCQFIGFDRYGEEYKVMGLAPYGEPRFLDELRKIIYIDKEKFSLDKSYFKVAEGFKNQMEDVNQSGEFYSSKLNDLLGNSRRRGDPVTNKEKDIAKSIQTLFEEISLNVLKKFNDRLPITNLNLSGGCALNGVLNAKILDKLPVKKMFIHPAASDDGTAVGAAFHCWHQRLKNKKRFYLNHSYLGSKYSRNEIKKYLDQENLIYSEFDINIVLKKIALLLYEKKVIGWFQGRSEWGPRALGNRSILASPLIQDMKKIINLKIKKRESFRPFAPSVLQEDVSKYFTQNILSPFMMHVVKFKDQWKSSFPAVTHVDSSARLQTVSEESNFLYYKLISEFKRLSNHGILLNTSFNENEPIVENPKNAIDCFKRTDLDVLVIGNFIISKKKILI